MPKTPPLLEIRDLRVSAEDGAILRGVDLTVGAGEMASATIELVLTGPPRWH